MNNNAVYYRTKTEEEFNNYWEQLENHGVKREYKWFFRDYPIILVEKNLTCNGYSKVPPSDVATEAKTWEDVLVFLGIKQREMPKKWFTYLNKQTGQALKKLRNSLPIYRDVQSIGYREGGFSWDSQNWYRDHSNEGWVEVSLEDAIRFIIELNNPIKKVVHREQTKKRVTVTFGDNFVIIGGQKYLKS